MTELGLIYGRPASHLSLKLWLLLPPTGQLHLVPNLNKEKVHTLTVGAEKIHRAGVVPVFVMLPIDSINHNDTANRREAMNASLQALGILPSMDAKSSQ